MSAEALSAYALWALPLALVLDALAGEPDWLWSRAPHPAIVIGRLIDRLDRALNEGTGQRAKGVVAILVLVAVATLAGLLIAAIPIAGPVLSVLLVAILLAQKSLVDHVRAVAEALPEGLDAARREIAKIVGRDPATLQEPDIARAAIESAAENLSDGVVAPAFWFAIAGLPGIVVYKAVNTADSMIGHKNDRYRDFGWAAARLDDLLNFIPARLAGILIAAAALTPAAFSVMVRDAGRHRSPNAGWPEAAMAGALGIALAGPRVYGGVPTDEPFLNGEGRRDIGVAEIDRAIAIVWRAWALLLAAAIIAALIF